MPRDLDALLASLNEPVPVPDQHISHGVALCDEVSGICRLIGWTEVPSSFPADPADPPERIVVLRVVMPLDRWREIVAQAAREMGLL